MGLVLNTNIGAIQAQRALTESRQEMEKAMERLSTGSRINSAADDAAGLAMVERMTTQIRGLTMATKNANDGIALIRTVENALVEVSGMLQRMRELAVQASNATNSATERAFADNELNQLQLEISRVSANTRYNGTQVLNGTYAAKSLQVGTMSGEEIKFSIDSVESTLLGAYIMSGEENVGAYAAATSTTTGYTSTTNLTDDADDITIEANGNTRVIDVSANNTAKDVAKKINSVAGATNVFAQARTFAHVAMTSAISENYKLVINGTTTAAFSISSSDVSDAVSKINAVNATTGVMASATNDNKILLEDADGDDIIIQNGSAGTNLTVTGVKSDGITEGGGVRSLESSGIEVAKVDIADVYAAYSKWANGGSPAAAGSLRTTFNGDTVTLTLATAADAGATSTSTTLGQDITAANFAARFGLAYNAHSGSTNSAATAGSADGATAGAKVVAFTQTNTGSFNDTNGLLAEINDGSVTKAAITGVDLRTKLALATTDETVTITFDGVAMDFTAKASGTTTVTTSGSEVIAKDASASDLLAFLQTLATNHSATYTVAANASDSSKFDFTKTASTAASGSFIYNTGATGGVQTTAAGGTTVAYAAAAFATATKADNSTSIVEASHAETVAGVAASADSRDTTKVVGTLRLNAANGFSVTQTNGGATTEVAKVDVADIYAAYLKHKAAATSGSIQTTFNGDTVTLTYAHSADAGASSTSSTLGNDITAANFAARFALAYNAHSGSVNSSASVGSADGATSNAKVVLFTQTNVGSFDDLQDLTVGADTDTTDGTIYTSVTKADNSTSVVETSHAEKVTGAASITDTFFANGTTTGTLQSVADVDIKTQIGASYSIATIDGALEIVSGMRGGLGTLQNRLDYSVSNLMKVTEYTIGARSRIQDADFAAETSRLAKAQVLQQAGASMLAQANASTDIVLQVLRG
jgi:flagellin